MITFLIAITFAVGQYDQESVSKFEPKLTGIKCVVSGKPVSGKYSCRFKDGKLFFDCNDSRRRFLEDRNSFIIKANHQLAVTGQYLQVKCPIKPVEIDRKQSGKKAIAGVEIFFCCGACQQHVLGKTNIHEQIRFIFDNGKFNSIFQPRAKLAGQNTASRK